MGRLRSNIGSWVFGMLQASVFIILSFIPQSAGAGYNEKKLLNTDPYTTMELKLVLENYQVKIDVLDTQISEVKKDINWLILKINRIQDAGQKAPYGLMKSVKAKEEKSKTLFKEKTRLEIVSSYYKKEFDLSKKRELDKILVLEQEEVVEEIIVKKVVPQILETIEKVPLQPIVDEFNTIQKIDLETAVKSAGLADWVEINGDVGCLRIETTLPILFSSGSAKVAKEYHSFFKKLADFLKSYDVKILVNGYADTLPINTKQYPSNFELGAARAANIIHELVKQGLKSSIFKIETTGEYRFAAKEPSKQKSFQRRARVTVIFTG
ncbi:MAG: OmpA family protein [Desulfobacteraceae bacterium]|nr:OmpA family protein [Desulfobacteraceae bacterium]